MRICRFLVVAAIAALIIQTSCNQQEGQSVPEGSTQPVMRSVSELVRLMYTMESDLKIIRMRLIEDSVFVMQECSGYESIFTAQVSKDVTRDSVFVSNATRFLEQIHLLNISMDRDSSVRYFNHAIDTCVNCHRHYCPGPIARIEKLGI